MSATSYTAATTFVSRKFGSENSKCFSSGNRARRMSMHMGPPKKRYSHGRHTRVGAEAAAPPTYAPPTTSSLTGCAKATCSELDDG
eukprot:15476101-Alexandrium_andersonii.AAC.1